MTEVIFHPKARANLLDLYGYLAEKAGEAVAENFVSGLHAYCDGLKTFPHRGTCRDDLYPGLRTLGYRKRATVTFMVRDQRVIILGVFYRGQDFEKHLPIDDGDV